ncbi:MAG: hypothetical protein JO318_18160, partial [Chloroflexi bacterium]|nr:hypothetical protein [Chloroflexota bacterium]
MPGQTATTICPYCGVGCGLRVDVAGGRVVRVRGDDAHPGTQGKLCRKAVYLPHAVYGEGRLEYPLMRETRDAVRRETTWDDALGRAAAQLQLII